MLFVFYHRVRKGLRFAQTITKNTELLSLCSLCRISVPSVVNYYLIQNPLVSKSVESTQPAVFRKISPFMNLLWKSFVWLSA